LLANLVKHGALVHDDDYASYGISNWVTCTMERCLS
jgi:hypothetical protein